MDPEDTEQMVPISRLNAKTAALKNAEERAKKAEARVAELEPLAGRAEKYQSQLKEERAAHAATKAASTETLTMVSAGITDPEDQELVRWRRGRLGDEAPPLDEYLKGAAREDRHLSALFSAPEPPAPASEDPPAPAPAPTAPPVGDNAGTAPAPAPVGGRLEEIQANMHDPAWRAANMAAVMKELGFPG